MSRSLREQEDLQLFELLLVSHGHGRAAVRARRSGDTPGAFGRPRGRRTTTAVPVPQPVTVGAPQAPDAAENAERPGGERPEPFALESLDLPGWLQAVRLSLARGGEGPSFPGSLCAWLQERSAMEEVGWASHVCWLLRHLLLTALSAILVPVLVPVTVDLMRGGFAGFIIVFSVDTLLSVALIWKVLGISGGSPPSLLLPSICSFTVFMLRYYAVDLWDLHPAVITLANWIPLFYLCSVFCVDSSRRATSEKAWLIVGSVMMYVPFGLGRMIRWWDTWAPRAGQANAETISMATVANAAPVVVWMLGGFFTQQAGLIVWRRASRGGATAVTMTFVLVHTEVTFATMGLQIFTGRALLPYALGTALMEALQTARLWFTLWRCCSGQRHQVLHVVRLLLGSLARFYGMYTGWVTVLLTSLAQFALHPQCRSSHLALPGYQEATWVFRAPTIPVNPMNMMLWFSSLALIITGILMALVAAAAALRRANSEVQRGPSLARRMGGPAVAGQAAGPEMLTPVLAIMRTCICCVELEVWMIVALNVSRMSFSWFLAGTLSGRSEFWQAWSRHSSWFTCE